MTAPRVVIAAGGTAGHVVPAIAVADALRADGAQVSWVGGRRAEAELVPAAGYPLDAMAVEGISRTNPLAAARAVGRAALALGAARAILARREADAVLGGGGYVAGPVGAVAAARGIPLVLTEADSHLGLTNRLLAPRARRVCLAFPIAGRTGERYRVTGRPVPPLEADRPAARAQLGIGGRERLVVVFGGSLGARSINRAAVAGLADPAGGLRVLHLAGHRDFPDLQAPGPHYDLRPYLQPLGRALLAADLVVARAGGSLFEVAAYGCPAILVPYPHAAADHQAANAEWMRAAGAAAVIADAELDGPTLQAAVRGLLDAPARLAAMAAASAGLARPDAAADVAREVLAAAAAGRG